jgi:PPIC-type PPIASE domain
MVRRFAVLSIVALAGCSGLRDAVTAHQNVVARAAGQELTVTELAQLIAPVKQVPLSRAVVDRLADLWVDYELLGHAVASGDSLLDSATVMEASWPTVMQAIANGYHDSTIVGRATVTAAEVDSAYNAGNVRWIDHILVRVAQDTTARVKAARRRVAEGYLAQLARGASFTRLAEEKSEDVQTAKSGGSLGLVRRGQLPRTFEDAAWSLSPGQISGIVQTAYGYHLIWRPPLAQVRDSFATALKGIEVERLDSLYMDSLTRHSDIKIKGSAPAAVRAAVQDMRDAKTNGRVLATYHGGELTLKEFARWLQAFPPQVPGELAQAADSSVSEFLASLVRNDIMLAQARAAHVRLTRADRDSITALYRRDLASMEDKLGVSAESLAATGPSASKATAEAHRVDAYFTDVISHPSSRPFFAVPPFLADVLRSRWPWSISPEGVDAALAEATKLRGPTTPRGIPEMTPAPSGPPISGGQRTPPPTRRIE